MARDTFGFHLNAITQHLSELATLLGTPRTAVAPLVIVDRHRHELRRGSRRVRLATRPVMRQLLYAFLASATRSLTRDEIAGALWSISYEPLRHENTLRSSVRRLRRLLRGIAEIRCESGDYRLQLAGELRVLEAR